MFFKTSWKIMLKYIHTYLNIFFFTLLEFILFHSNLSSHTSSTKPSMIFSSSQSLQSFENNDDCNDAHRKSYRVPDTILSTLRVNSWNPHTQFLKVLYPFNSYRGGNLGTENLINLLKVTELASGRVIAQIQAAWPQSPNA